MRPCGSCSLISAATRRIGQRVSDTLRHFRNVAVSIKCAQAHFLLLFLSVEKRHGRRMRAALEAYHADELRVPSHVPKGKNCREIIDFCEFMVSKGASIAYIVQDVCYEFEKDHDFDESQIDGLLALLRWAVSRGVDVNRIHNGETGLDFLNRKLAFPEIWCD